MYNNRFYLTKRSITSQETTQKSFMHWIQKPMPLSTLRNSPMKHIYILLIAITLLSRCSEKSHDHEQSNDAHEASNTVELTEGQFEQAGIKISAIEKRTIGSELRVNGKIDVPPQSNISINMPYGGFIKYIEMLPGTNVKKGDLLVIIENPDFIQFQQDYLESLANQEFLQSEYQRQETLFEEHVASAKNFQQAKSIYLSNEARIKALEERLKLIGFNPEKVRKGKVSGTVNIYAPVTGAVREVYTNIGKYISPQDVIMNITNSDDLHVELTVYEDDIPKVKIDQRIRFALASTPGHWREASVFLVGSGVREDRSVTVHGHLKEHYDDLLPGMYVSAKIETGSNESWTVPEEAIVRFEGKYYVFSYSGKRTENGKLVHDFDMLAAHKGITEDGYTEISLQDTSIAIDQVKLASKGAFTLLAKAKNTEEEGGHHH